MSQLNITVNDVAETIESQLDSLFEDELGQHYSASLAGSDEINITFGNQHFLVKVEEIK